MKYTKILVPLDGSAVSEQILPYARVFVGRCGMQPKLLGAIDSDVNVASMPHREYLEKTAAKYLSGSTPVDLIEEHGSAAEVIVDTAKAEPDCLIAMATNGRSGIKRLLLGSVATKVLQAAENPLFLVRVKEQSGTAEPPTLNSVIVPLDGSELGESVLPIVIDIARMMGLEIVVTQAYELPSTAYYRTEDYSGGEEFVPTYDEVVAEASNSARGYLDKMVERVRGQGIENVRAVLLRGRPAEEIITLSTAASDSFLAMCTHGRSGVRRWVLGSVTEHVVQHASVPVLTIRAAKP
jgi:nucleotide-binding universal stress UspA family protein